MIVVKMGTHGTLRFQGQVMGGGLIGEAGIGAGTGPIMGPQKEFDTAHSMFAYAANIISPHKFDSKFKSAVAQRMGLRFREAIRVAILKQQFPGASVALSPLTVGIKTAGGGKVSGAQLGKLSGSGGLPLVPGAGGGRGKISGMPLASSGRGHSFVRGRKGGRLVSYPKHMEKRGDRVFYGDAKKLIHKGRLTSGVSMRSAGVGRSLVYFKGTTPSGSGQKRSLGMVAYLMEFGRPAMPVTAKMRGFLLNRIKQGGWPPGFLAKLKKGAMINRTPPRPFFKPTLERMKPLFEQIIVSMVTMEFARAAATGNKK